MDKLCDRIICWFVSRKLIESEDHELYSYALNVLICTTINFITIMLISTILRMPLQGFVYFGSFFLLRKFTGGLHANSFLGCYLFSTISTVLLFLCIKTNLNRMDIPIVGKYILFGALTLALIVILLFAPFENKNKPLTEKEKKVYKWIAFGIAVVLCVFCVILMHRKNSLFLGSTAGIFLTAALLLFSVSAKALTDFSKKTKI